MNSSSKPQRDIGTRYSYSTLSGGDRDYSRLVCHDCSTRTLVHVIPADEQADHDQWHEDTDVLAPFSVQRFTTGREVTMGDGSTQPETFAQIYRESVYTGICVRLNATVFAAPQPFGHGSGIEATDAQIILAVLGDEHVFSGAPTHPEYHDEVTP